MLTQERFVAMIANKKQSIEKLRVLNEKLTTSLSQETSETKQETFKQHIADNENKIQKLEATVEFMRFNSSKENVAERLDMLENFAGEVNAAIADNCPMVFHGTNNIGTAKEILKSGGLFTPEERGVSMTSFATQIDVTCKKDIRVSCEFAEPGIDTYLPYGAIFAFMPKKEEEEKVLNCNSSEVAGGVGSVNFKEEPERFVGIITTEENQERVNTWCKEFGYDQNKVFSQSSFIDYCKENFAQKETTQDRVI